MNTLSGIMSGAPWCERNEIKGDQGNRNSDSRELLKRID